MANPVVEHVYKQKRRSSYANLFSTFQSADLLGQQERE